MSVIKTIGPNQAGAKNFKARYGQRLVAVQYRKELGRRLITIEVIVVSTPHHKMRVALFSFTRNVATL